MDPKLIKKSKFRVYAVINRTIANQDPVPGGRHTDVSDGVSRVTHGPHGLEIVTLHQVGDASHRSLFLCDEVVIDMMAQGGGRRRVSFFLGKRVLYYPVDLDAFSSDAAVGRFVWPGAVVRATEDTIVGPPSPDDARPLHTTTVIFGKKIEGRSW